MERTGRSERWPFDTYVDISFVSMPAGQSALEYFSKRFRDSLKLKADQDSEAPEEIVMGTAELYGRMIPRVMEARRVLEADARGLLDSWQEATGSRRMAYQTVLTDVVMQNPWMRQLHADGGGAEEMYAADCHNAVLWLGGWLRAENAVD